MKTKSLRGRPRGANIAMASQCLPIFSLLVITAMAFSSLALSTQSVATQERENAMPTLTGDAAATQTANSTDSAVPSAEDYVFRQRILNPGDAQTWITRPVGISGNTAVINGYAETGHFVDVYIWDGDEWRFQQRIDPPGDSIEGTLNPAISGDTIVIGDEGFFGVDPKAYVYARSGSTWSPQDILYPTGGTIVDFASDVAIRDDTIMISDPWNNFVVQGEGAPGAVFVFRRSGSTWSQTQRLTGSPAQKFFGTGLDISGDTALIMEGPTESSYNAYIFAESSGVWTQQQVIQPPLSSPRTGEARLDGDTAVIPVMDGALVYQRSGPSFSFYQQLFTTANNVCRVDIFGDKIAVFCDSLQPEGTFIFSRGPTNWAETQNLNPATSIHRSAAMSGRWLFITDNVTNMTGSMNIYDLGAAVDIDMRRPNTASLTQVSIDQGLVNIDAPLEYNTNRVELALAPIVEKGLVADGVTPLLFDIEIPVEELNNGSVQADVEVEIVSGGTLDGDAIADRMRYLGLTEWDTVPNLTFSESDNKHFAYLKPIGSDEVLFEPGENEIEVKLRLRQQGTSEDLGFKTFYIRKPPIALIHGYNTDGTWGDDFKDELGASRPRGSGANEDFVRTIRYGQVPEGAAAHTQEATILPFNVLANTALTEFNAMKDSIDDGWALTRYDVVAHSQGGVLSRMLTSRNGNTYVGQPFRNADNFNRGRFHRVVTIGSPHNGTRIVRYTAALREINQQTWMPVGLPNSISSLLFSSGAAQYKFDPIGSEIQNINRTDAGAPWLPDADAKFHLVATTVGNGQPPNAAAHSLADANIGLAGPNGAIVLPRGADGVVDFDAMIGTTPSGGQSAPPNTFQIPVGNQISHAYFALPVAASYAVGVGEDLFGGDSGQVISDFVGLHVIRALDQSDDIPAPDRVFGPFQLPARISQGQIDAIQNAAETLFGLNDAIIQYLGPRTEGRLASSSASYTYNFQLPAGETFAAPVLWTAERYGVDGSGATGLTVANVSGFPGRAQLTADTTIPGDVVLRGTATTVSGKVFVGEPVLVASNDPDSGTYTRTSIAVDPSSGIYEAGSGVFPVLYENYANTSPGGPALKLRRWFYDQALQAVSTNTAVVDPSAKIEWKFPAAGTATVNVTWRGLNASVEFVISAENIPAPTRTSTSTPMQTSTATATNTATSTATATATNTPTIAPSPTPSFIVTNANDSGAGSLRQAVLDANAQAGTDTIAFDPAFFNVPRTITLISGDIQFPNTNVANANIYGPGANLLTISGNNSSRIFTLFENPQVTITDMTLTGGNGVSTAATTLGGAICNFGNLTLNNMVISGNSAAGDGGGLYTSSSDTITLNNCLVTGNTANSDNNTTGAGGGAFAQAGTININNSVISNNNVQGSTRNGGGLGLTAANSFISISNSTVTGNTAATGGGIGIGSSGQVQAVRSTITDNDATVSHGGGIWGNSTFLDIQNSTISGNTAVGSGGGIYRTGVSPVAGPGSITQATILNNTATGPGGGMHNAAGVTVIPVRGSILANNIDDGTAPDLFGTINSGGYNLIKSILGATVNGDTATNITGVDPDLGPLQNNGGLTFTHLPNAASPAIDKGAFFNVVGIADQRGIARPVDFAGIPNAAGGNGADIGSVEVQNAGSPTATSTLTPTNTPANTPTATSTSTNTPTATLTNTPTATPTVEQAISGTVTYGNAIPAATRFVSNVLISGAGSPTIMTTTAAPGANAGQYTLTGFGAGSYIVTPTKTGGVNNITSFDAARISQHVAGPPNPQLTGNQLVVADVSGNSVVSSFDAAMIAKFVAGPPYVAPGIGSTSTWRFTPANKNYATVASSITGEDYSALLLGEVSGNWNNTGARPADRRRETGDLSEEAYGSEKADIVFSMPGISAKDGEITIPVSVQGVADKGVISYEFDLRYDPTVMQPLVEPVDVTGTVSRGLSVVTNATEPGLLRVVVYGAYPIDGDGVLLNLRFTAVGSSGSVSPISFERIMFNEGEPRVIVTDGKIELLD